MLAMRLRRMPLACTLSHVCPYRACVRVSTAVAQCHVIADALVRTRVVARLPLSLHRAQSRASVRAQVAPDGVLCGSDPKAGGTWMGLNVKTGRFTVLTNLGGATKAGQPSRGAMVLAFLRQRLSGAAAGVSVKDAVSELLRARKEYAPFNLLWADVYAEHPAVHCESRVRVVRELNSVATSLDLTRLTA